MVRGIARDLASSLDLDLVLIDGSHGIMCPVIASLSGVDLALVVNRAHHLRRRMTWRGFWG
jgi:MinD superfamily P-loop ATPase